MGNLGLQPAAGLVLGLDRRSHGFVGSLQRRAESVERLVVPLAPAAPGGHLELPAGLGGGEAGLAHGHLGAGHLTFELGDGVAVIGRQGGVEVGQG